MRPANGLNAAREMIFSYVMHAARERMKYIKHAARELISYVMHAAREKILQSIKILKNEAAVHLWNLPKNFFDAMFFLEKEKFFDGVFFLEKNIFRTTFFLKKFSSPREDKFTPCGP